MMVGGEILCRPIPVNVHDRVARWAAELGVDGHAVSVARAVVAGAYSAAQSDLYRHGYWGEFSALRHDVSADVGQFGTVAFAATVAPNPELLDRWRALEHCAAGTFGRCTYEFYALHNFLLPGNVGAANEITAHHDWIHVLADYSASGLGEIETAAFRMTSTRMAGTMLTFIGELGFWHSGMIGSAFTGFHQAYSLDAAGAPESVAEAFARGSQCNQDLYCDIDFFDYKDYPLEALREEWNIPAKQAAHSAGWRTRVQLTEADGESTLPPVF